MNEAEHWLFAIGAAVVMGLPIIYLVTKLGVAAGIKAFYEKLDMLRAEIHEIKGEFDSKLNRNWDYIRTVNGNVGRLEDRVARLEGDTGEE